jgi:hypothetical protein
VLDENLPVPLVLLLGPLVYFSVSRYGRSFPLAVDMRKSCSLRFLSGFIFGVWHLWIVDFGSGQRATPGLVCEFITCHKGYQGRTQLQEMY